MLKGAARVTMTRFSFHFSVVLGCIVAVLSLPVQAEPSKSAAAQAKATAKRADKTKPASSEKTTKEPEKAAPPASPAAADKKHPSKSDKKSPEDSKTDTKPAKKASVEVPKGQTTTAAVAPTLKTDIPSPVKVSKQPTAKLEAKPVASTKIEAVKGKPGVVTKVVTEAASTVSTATGSAAALAKTTGKAASPGGKSEIHKVHRPAMSLVPPPPPETPTVLAVPGMLQTFGIPFDQTPTNFPQHHKELVAQLNSAKKVLDDKTQHATDVQARAEQFKSLFAEGVISKRELENAQSEADSSVNDLNDAKLKVSSLQSALTRLEERMSASSKTGKGAKGHQSNNKKVAQKKAVQADASKATNKLLKQTSDKAQTLAVTDKTPPHNAVATKATTSSAGVGTLAGSTTTIKSATANSASANTATSTTTAISSSKPAAPVTSDEGKKPPTLPGDAVKDSIQ